MALGTVQQIVAAGTAGTYAVPLATELVAANDDIFLHVKNANASPCVVTITDPGLTPAGSAATNPAISVPASTGDKMIPLSSLFASPTTSLITVAFSVQTSVSVALYRM